MAEVKSYMRHIKFSQCEQAAAYGIGLAFSLLHLFLQETELSPSFTCRDLNGSRFCRQGVQHYLTLTVIISSVFGCTIVFTIPVGLAAIREEDKPCFTRGILLGFLAMPFAIFAGGLAMGLSLGRILWNSLPVVVLCGLLALGVLKKPQAMEKGFTLFGKCIQVLSTLGLILAAVTHMTGLTILGKMLPLQQAMQTVSAIGIVMLGSMPLAELLQRVLRIPFAWISRKTGLNSVSTTGLILGLVSATPTLAMLPEMDERGKVVSASCRVSGRSLPGFCTVRSVGVRQREVPPVK